MKANVSVLFQSSFMWTLTLSNSIFSSKWKKKEAQEDQAYVCAHQKGKEERTNAWSVRLPFSFQELGGYQLVRTLLKKRWRVRTLTANKLLKEKMAMIDTGLLFQHCAAAQRKRASVDHHCHFLHEVLKVGSERALFFQMFVCKRTKGKRAYARPQALHGHPAGLSLSTAGCSFIFLLLLLVMSDLLCLDQQNENMENERIPSTRHQD